MLDPDEISWQQLLNVAPNSAEFLELAKTLLSSENHRKFSVSQLTDEQAVQLVDVIDIGVRRSHRCALVPNPPDSRSYGTRNFRTILRASPLEYFVDYLGGSKNYPNPI